MGRKGSVGKVQSIKFPIWMANSIEEIAEKGGHTFTDVVLDLLRQELAAMGYNMGIGREAALQKKAEPHRTDAIAEPAKKEVKSKKKAG